MKKRLYWVVGAFIAVFVLTFIFYAVKMRMLREYMASFKPPPVYVSTEKVKEASWRTELSAVGNLVARNGVSVNSDVGGQVLSINFHSGDFVKKGDLLVQLDDAVDEQNLVRDLAKLRLDKLDYERKQKLVKQSAISRSALDAARAAYFQTMAAVAADKVMLSKKKIRAPFSGKLGIRQVNVGEYLSAGKGVVSLQALQPLFVDFSLPEQNLALLKKGQNIEVKVDAYPKSTFNGKIIALNSKATIDTRSIDVRGEIPNKDNLLYPGLFANVTVILPEKKRQVVIPQVAITYSLYGDSVYVVKKDPLKSEKKQHKKSTRLIVEQRFIKLGQRRGTIASVKSGLKPGEVVVTAGQVKLHNKAVVLINNKVKPN